MLKKNLLSIGIGLLLSVPIAILAWTEQTKPEIVDIPQELETETYTEYVPLQSEIQNTEVAPVQPYPVYDFIPLSEELQIYTCEVAESYEISPLVVYAIMWQESRFETEAINSSSVEHSVGLMQLNLMWHKARMDKLGVTNASEPKQNILLGIDYLAELINYEDRMDISLEWVFMAYNAGPTGADEMAARGEVSEYAVSVLDKLYEYSEMEGANGDY